MKTKGIITSEQISNYNQENGGFIKINTAINNELSLKRMLISCFAYGGLAKDSWQYNEYILPYQKKMSEKLFNDIYEEMLESFKNCEVKHDVYTDGEGCSYNTIIYK